MSEKKKNTGTKKQKELPGMPAMTPLAKIATDFTDIISNMETLKNKFDDTRVELINLFKKEKRTSITVDGITLTYSHLEKDQIKVKQPE